MMRIFVNCFPWSWGLELRAYKIESQLVCAIKTVVSVEEQDNRVGLSLWSIHNLKISQYLPLDKYDHTHPLYEHDHFGTLVERRDGMYIFTDYFIQRGHSPIEIPLPSKKELKKLKLFGTKP